MTTKHLWLVPWSSIGHGTHGDAMRTRALLVLAIAATALVACGDDDKVLGAGDGQDLTIVTDGHVGDDPVGIAKGTMMKGEVGNTCVDLKRKISRIDNTGRRAGRGRDNAEDKHHDLCKSQLI